MSNKVEIGSYITYNEDDALVPTTPRDPDAIGQVINIENGKYHLRDMNSPNPFGELEISEISDKNLPIDFENSTWESLPERVQIRIGKTEAHIIRSRAELRSLFNLLKKVDDNTIEKKKKVSTEGIII